MKDVSPSHTCFFFFRVLEYVWKSVTLADYCVVFLEIIPFLYYTIISLYMCIY